MRARQPREQVRPVPARAARSSTPTASPRPSSRWTGESEEFVAEVREFIDGLVSHYVLDGGRLVVCHAGLPEKYHGRTSGRVRSHALYGDTTGETDEFGLPVRYPWAEDYRGRAAVVYGHTPVPEATWLNNTICLDTGAVFGGKLTALRWPERELVDVPAEQVWYEPTKPLAARRRAGRTAARWTWPTCTGRRVVETRHLGRVAVREENAAAALEVMSRFAVDPRLLPYLPPTMAPDGHLARRGLPGTPGGGLRAVPRRTASPGSCARRSTWARGRSPWCAGTRTSARERFGVRRARPAPLYTRTGRPFFDDARGHRGDPRPAAHGGRRGRPVGRAGHGLAAAGRRADALVAEGVRAAARRSTRPWAPPPARCFPQALSRPAGRGRARRRRGGPAVPHSANAPTDAAAFTDAYRRYCWTTDGLDGVRLAPFQILAVQGRSLAGLPHDEQLALLDRLVEHDGTGLLQTTRRLYVDTGDPESVRAGVDWWLEMTGRGGEGMVVKPVGAVVRDGQGRLVQPGIKCRGREYLRIIYGPEYTRPDNLARLRAAVPQPQAVARAPRVRARPGGPGPAGRGRAAVAGPRGGVRGAGPGVGAGGPEAVVPCRDP